MPWGYPQERGRACPPQTRADLFGYCRGAVLSALGYGDLGGRQGIDLEILLGDDIPAHHILNFARPRVPSQDAGPADAVL